MFKIPSADASTYYVRNISGTYKYLQNAWPTESTGTGCSANTLRGCVYSLDGNGDTMVVAAGDYGEDGRLNFYTGTGNITVRTVTESDPDFATYGGTVIIGPASTAVQIINCQSGISNVTVQANASSPMIVKGSSATLDAGYDVNAGSGTSANNVFDGLTFYKYSTANSDMVKVYSVTTVNSGIEIKNSTFQNRSYSAGSDSEKFEYGSDTLNGTAINLTGTGTAPKVYNNVIGSADYRFTEGIKVAMANSEVYGNTIDYSWDGDNYPDGSGDPLMIIGSSVTGTRTYNNLIRYGNKGIQLKNGAYNNYVYSNIVVNSAVNGIDNYNSNTGAFNYIENNTVIQIGTGSNGHGIVHQGSPGKLFVKNNLIYNTGGDGIDCYTYGASVANDSWDADYNLCYLTSIGNWSQITGNYATLAEHQVAAAADDRFVDDIFEPDTHSLESNPLFTDYAGADYSLQPLSPAIDAGTNLYLTTDYAGNSIYGNPDLGAYEYQPPYTIGTDNIPATGSIRIYSDGKYRLASATSTTNASSLTVTPITGSWLATTTNYMDITVNTWNTSGDYSKQWTATSIEDTFSTLATSTLYTVGDLNPYSQYTLSIDSVASSAVTDNSQCTDGVCIADSNGDISFVYTGGYSTHIFSLDDITAPSLTETTSVDAYTTDTTPSYTFSSDESGTINYGGSCSSGTTSINANSDTTITFSTLADGTYTDCGISVTDAASNTSATTTLSSFTVDTANPSVSASTPTGGITDRTPTFTWSGSDDTSGISAYELYIDGSSYTTTANTSIDVSGNLACGAHTWYVIATDNTSNTTTSDTKTFNISCGGGTIMGIFGSTGGLLDSDGDGVPDVTERANGTDPYQNDKISTPQENTNNPEQSNTNPGNTSNTNAMSSYTFANYLARGSTGPEVSLLQNVLKSLGFFTYSKITTYFGTITEEAVKAFQKAHGIEETGTVGPITRSILNGINSTNHEEVSQTSLPSFFEFNKGLYLGMTHPDIIELQKLLNRDKDTIVAENGFGSPNNETNYFGEATLQAVQKFQLKYNITNVDDKAYGYVGPKTRDQLNKILQEK